MLTYNIRLLLQRAPDCHTLFINCSPVCRQVEPLCNLSPKVGCQLWQVSMLAFTPARATDLFACCKRSVCNLQLHNYLVWEKGWKGSSPFWKSVLPFAIMFTQVILQGICFSLHVLIYSFQWWAGIKKACGKCFNGQRLCVRWILLFRITLYSCK